MGPRGVAEETAAPEWEKLNLRVKAILCFLSASPTPNMGGGSSRSFLLHSEFEASLDYRRLRRRREKQSGEGKKSGQRGPMGIDIEPF